MLFTVVGLLFVGLVAGALARLLVPGRDVIGIGGTVGIGIAGSFVGGFLGYVMFHHDAGHGAFQASGLIGSVIGAVIVLLAYRAVSGHRATGYR